MPFCLEITIRFSMNSRCSDDARETAAHYSKNVTLEGSKDPLWRGAPSAQCCLPHSSPLSPGNSLCDSSQNLPPFPRVSCRLPSHSGRHSEGGSVLICFKLGTPEPSECRSGQTVPQKGRCRILLQDRALWKEHPGCLVPQPLGNNN